VSAFYHVFKTIAFQFDPEFVHNFSLNLFEEIPLLAHLWNFPCDNSKYSLEINGNTWDFPVGLAAGFDENGKAISFFTKLNFGAVEIGTVTPKFQIGNEKPRLWRYPGEESLRNAMGFNNLGAELVYQNIAGANKNGKIVGVNIGKNKLTSRENAAEDYQILYDKFAGVVDYLVVNVSSPNTPGLRDLLGREFLKEIFIGLEGGRKKNPKPLYLKISPDQDFQHLKDTIEVAKEFGLSGIIATNTTVMEARGKGGISGKLLRDKSRTVRKFVMDRIKEVDHMQMIAVGGISTFDDIWEHWKAGGKLVQIYTSFVYKGPSILLEFKNEIDRILLKNKMNNLNELLENIKDAQR